MKQAEPSQQGSHISSLKTVFLSSTSRDLAKHREAVVAAIEGLDSYHCVRMENFGARDWAADDFCRAKVAECDVFVGIVGHLYGSCPEGSEQSYTDREHGAAVTANKPRLMFIAPEDFPLPANLIEPDEKRQKQRAFRERVSSERIRDTFTASDDLARRVVQAIHNWEQEQTTAQRRPVIDRTATIMPLPPQPYFAYPYPMQANFTGRVRERTMLTKWLTSGQQPVLTLIAIGGMGKSALSWAWLQHDVLGFLLPGLPHDSPEVADACRVPERGRPEGVLWWSFYEHEARFATFLNEALSYAGGGNVNPANISSTYEKVKALVTLLQQRHLLLVLDGFERELRAYASLSAAYQGDTVTEDDQGDFRACTDLHAADFLRRIASLPLQSCVLLTSRLFPRELDGLAGCERKGLNALASEDAVTFFHTQGVHGTRAEIQDACQPYGYHPLALRLLAGVIVKDKRNPGDVQVAQRYPVLTALKGKEQHHILQVAYDAMAKPKRTLLSRIAAFRSPMTYDVLTIFNTYKSEQQFDADLDELIDRGLLFSDRKQGRYDLHPVVRQYAYDCLMNKKVVHARLQNYFATIPASNKEKLLSVEDLAPVIELYHHTIHAGRYDKAHELSRDRLIKPLFFRFGAYQTCIELLRALFPDGEDHLPRLKDKGAQTETLDTLALSYSASGQTRRAVPLFEVTNALREEASNKRDLGFAIGLINLARMAQILLGELKAAEESLRRSIELCHEIGSADWEAVSYCFLGGLQVYQGKFDEVEQTLTTACELSALSNPSYSDLVWTCRTQRALLMKNGRTALAAARQARLLANRRDHERDIIESEWLLGASLVALASEGMSQQNAFMTEAETHLTAALIRCRRINLVEFEPDILLIWARWHCLKGDAQQAWEHTEGALTIADRCEYRLKQAEIHNFLARLALDAGDREVARQHAQIARECAWCDGPPYCYKPALDEAEGLLHAIADKRK